MRRFIVAWALLLLVAGGAISQQAPAEEDNDSGDESDVAIVVGPDSGDILLTDGNVLISATDLGEDDFVMTWGNAPGETRERTFNSGRTYYRTVPLNISLFSPIEIFPFDDKQVMGTAISILYGSTASLIGIQAGVVNHVSDRLYGIQAGAVALCDGISYGIRVGGLVNIGKRHGGISIGGLYHRYSEDGTFGLMAGLFNHAQAFTGLQIGAINYSTHLRGVQIGVVNINPDGMLPFTLGINFGW